jgi:outer membrane protein OmpA-like peptidoglycan-associated protein
MQKLLSFAALVTASLITITVENAWSDETAPGWYPPPPGRGGYVQRWQQPPRWTASPWGYAQVPPGYPPRGGYRVAPGVPPAAQNPLSAELEQTQEQLAAKTSELDEAHATVEQLRTRLEHSLETEQALGQKVMALSSERDTLQAHMTDLTGKLNTTTSALEQHRQQSANDQAQTQALTAERDQLHSDLAARDEQLGSLQAELEAAKQALQQAQTETTTSTQALSDAKAQAETLKSQVADLTAQLESQQTAQSEAEQALTAERDQLHSDLAARDEQLGSLQAELEAATQALQQAQSETTTSTQALSDAKAEAETLKSQVSELTAQLETQQAQNATSTQALSDAKAQTETLKSQVAELEAQLETRKTAQLDIKQTLTAQRDQLRSDLASREEQLAALQSELQTTGQGLQKAQTESATASEATSDAKARTAAGEGPEAGAAEIAALQTAGPDTDGDGITDAVDLCPGTQQGAVVEPTGCVAGAAVNLDGVTFSDDGYELTDEARLTLDRVAAIIRQHSGLRLQVAGHTDAQGDPAHNQWLSLQRAQTVRDYLVAQGVDARHIGAVGYGGQRPIADSATSEGQQTNQRVELRSLR